MEAQRAGGDEPWNSSESEINIDLFWSKNALKQ